MTTNPNWPLVSVQVAFNAGPNTAGDPTWTDITPRVKDLGGQSGKQYELDQVQAGEWTMTLLNDDEALNPINTASPYWPNVKPYRRLSVQAQWPPAPVGGATNLLNAGARQPANGVFYDPSFESYSAGASVPWIGPISTSPTVTTARAYVGTKACVWSTTGNSQQQGIQVTVRTIPGQQYTASVWVYQTAANPMQIYALGLETGTFTTDINAWRRVQVTFTATLTQHDLWIGAVVPTHSGSTYIDAIQLEPGATATTWSATGPVIYGVFGGYVERWPTSWDLAGRRGWVTVTCVDPIAILSQQGINSEVTNRIVSTAPDYYWPLWEEQGAATFGEASGHGGPPLVQRVSPYGPGVGIDVGQGSAIIGDPNGTGVRWVNADAAQQGIVLTSDPSISGSTGVAPVPASLTSWAFTMAAWVHYDHPDDGSTPAGLVGILFGGQQTGSALYSPIELVLTNGAIPAVQWYGNPVQQVPVFAKSPYSIDDDKWHHICGRTWTDGTTIYTEIFVDGVSQDYETGAVSSVGQLIGRSNIVQVGGEATSDGFVLLVNGTVSHVALWTRMLSTDEIYGLSYAGTTGYGAPYSGDPESSGVRIERWINYGYGGPRLIEPGVSLMGPSDATKGASTLNLALGVQQSENGVLWADGDGYVRYVGRTNRYLATTPLWTLGEQYVPYTGDINFEYDPTQVYNDVQVTRAGGISLDIVDSPSADDYGTRSLSRSLTIASDNETIDAANYLLNRYKQPIVRMDHVTVDAAADPSRWPTVLGMAQNDRIRVVRTTQAFTMDGDYFIEQLAPQISFTDGSWSVAVQASPADKQQVWILGDPVFGVLDSTTVLAY